MTGPVEKPEVPGAESLLTTRRGLLVSAAALLTAACAPRSGNPVNGNTASGAATADPPPGTGANAAAVAPPPAIEPFRGAHQGGIITPAQNHTYFIACDLTTTSRDDVVALLKRWTLAAERMAAGLSAEPEAPVAASATAASTTTSTDDAPAPPASDTGEALGLPPARLTVTFGFGAGLFTKDGKDRYGLAAKRPAALVDMPKFAGDQLQPERSGGDLSIQACADDPQVAFHAVRNLARIANGVAQMRWLQAGFIAGFGRSTPRNLMGFKDGTGNPAADDPVMMARHVWVGEEGPDWMQGGSYVVARRSRIALEHWDQMSVAAQEQTFGRSKGVGAPLTGKDEKDAVDLEATDQDGNFIIPENSHVRLGHHLSNDGARVLRRSYSYHDGANVTAERWPPWRNQLEYDAGLLFVCYQRDPRTGFIKIFDKMSKFDQMNQFVTNTSSALFACPHGVGPGGFIGQELFA
jgi:deferrochelatase/peroxidase EfeB